MIDKDSLHDAINSDDSLTDAEKREMYTSELERIESEEEQENGFK